MEQVKINEGKEKDIGDLVEEIGYALKSEANPKYDLPQAKRNCYLRDLKNFMSI